MMKHQQPNKKLFSKWSVLVWLLLYIVLLLSIHAGIKPYAEQHLALLASTFFFYLLLGMWLNQSYH